MERLMRSNSKNNGIGAKNNKTLKQEQSPKGISKNVKTAVQKMKTAIKRHVIGSGSSITRGLPESKVKNNSTLKRKSNANMQKESPNKRNNRQTSAVSKEISNTSGHAPASSSGIASKKKTDSSKGTGKILKRNKKVDKSKIINTKNAVKNKIPVPSCRSFLAVYDSNRWLRKRMEKYNSPAEVARRYTAKARMQQLRERLNKEAESENSSLNAEDYGQIMEGILLRERGLIIGNGFRDPAASFQMEPLEFGRGLREPATNLQMELLEFGRGRREPTSPTTEFESTSTNVQNVAARLLPNTHVQNSAVHLPLLNLNVHNSASGQSSTSRYVQNNATVQPLPYTFVQSSAAAQPSTSTYEQNSAARQPLPYTFVQSNTAARTDIQPNTSAQFQLPVFQEPLAYLNEVNAIQSTAYNNMQLHMLIPEPQSEDMDIDFDDTASPNPFVHSSCPQSEQRLVIVIDTNVFIHNLPVIRHIVSSYFIGFVEKPTIVIPWRVINELDGLKDNTTKSAVQRLANDALNYLYEMLPKNQWIIGQTVKEAEQRLFVCEVPDDEVLNCCLQHTAQGNSVILLSNDKNLCNKGTINGIKNMSSFQIEKKLEDRLFNYKPGELIEARFRIYKSNIYNLLSTILRGDMQRTFKGNWPLMIFKNPPWSLMNVLDCIIHHWAAVFATTLPKIKNSIIKLKNILSKLDETAMAALTDNEVTAFQGICANIAHKCLIVPDHMSLAVSTIKALEYSPNMDIETKELRQEKTINDVFQNMYAFVSSYCAKVCVGLSVEHNLEDSVPTNETVDELLTILPLFNRLVNKVTQTLLQLLNADSDSVSLHATNLNSVCVEIKDTFAFLNKCDMTPTYYFAKCRDLVLKEYKAYLDIGKLLQSCLNEVRLNTLRSM